jgi:hypothetical protein
VRDVAKAVVVLTTLVLCMASGCVGLWMWGVRDSGKRSQAEKEHAQVKVVEQARAFGDAVVAWSRAAVPDDSDLHVVATYHHVVIRGITRDPAFILDLESTASYQTLFGTTRISKCFHLIFFGATGSAGFDMTETTCVSNWADPTPTVTRSGS